RHRGHRLDVVDDGRRGVQARHGRGGGPQSRLAATTLERVKQGGLLAADVRAGTGGDDQVEVVARAVDVTPDVPGFVRLADGAAQASDHVQHLAADVDERVVGADRARGDDDTLDQHVRVGHHQRDVLAGARLGLVRVDHQVL